MDWARFTSQNHPAYGGEGTDTSFAVGLGHLNLIAVPESRRWGWWGWVILSVDDVDALYHRVLALGLHPEGPPTDAPWGERFFHLVDPDRHELSFAHRSASSS